MNQGQLSTEWTVYCLSYHPSLYCIIIVCHISHTALPPTVLYPYSVVHHIQPPAPITVSYPLTVLYTTYSPAPHSAVHHIQPPASHCVDGLSLDSGYVVPSCQHSIDGVPTVEALHISDSHIVVSHANGPLGEEGGEGGRRDIGRKVLQSNLVLVVYNI